MSTLKLIGIMVGILCGLIMYDRMLQEYENVFKSDKDAKKEMEVLM